MDNIWKEKYFQLLGEHSELVQRSSENKQILDKLLKQGLFDKNKLQEITKENLHLKREIDQYHKKQCLYQSQCQQISELYSQKKQELDYLYSEYSNVQKQLINWQSDYSVLQVKYNKLRTKYKNLKQNNYQLHDTQNEYTDLGMFDRDVTIDNSFLINLASPTANTCAPSCQSFQKDQSDKSILKYLDTPIRAAGSLIEISPLLSLISPTKKLSQSFGPKVQSSFISQRQQGYAIKLVSEFFIIGVPFPDQTTIPEILYQYPTPLNMQNNSLIEFCFPNEVGVKRLSLTESSSEFNLLLLGQNVTCRNENFYVFTLKSGSENDDRAQYPNQNKELIYYCCIEIKDISYDQQWIVPKCLCISSYFPCFDFLFLILQQLYAQMRIKRIENMNNVQFNLQQDVLSEDSQDFIDSLGQERIIEANKKLRIEHELLDGIEFTFPSDLNQIDTSWVLPPLLSALRSIDLYWLIMALLQEKSIVFVSCNKCLLTSAVLGLQSLIRPFKWPHTQSSMLPQSLHEVLQAPVPILVGILGKRLLKNEYVELIKVNLDNPDVNKRVVASKSLIRQVKEPFANNLKSNLTHFFKLFQAQRIIYNPTDNQISAGQQISQLFQCYFRSILEAYPVDLSITQDLNQSQLKDALKQRLPVPDHKFIELLASTIIFSISAEQFFNNF